MVRRSRLVDWPRGAIVDYDARFRATQRRYASARRPRSADALPQRSSRLGLGEQVQPERRFISFFDDDAQLRDEVVIRAATAGGTVVGADASSVFGRERQTRIMSTAKFFVRCRSLAGVTRRVQRTTSAHSPRKIFRRIQPTVTEDSQNLQSLITNH